MRFPPTTAWLLALALVGVSTAACRDPVGPGDAGDAGDADEPAGRTDLRVMTWNLETFPKAATTVATVVPIVDQLDLDLLAVQEITDDSAFNRVLSALPEHDGAIADDTGSDSRVGLMWRATRVDVMRVETLFTGDRQAFPRPALVAWFRVDRPGGGTAFDAVVAVLHLKAGFDSDSEARRRDACERLEAWVAAEVARGEEPDVILLGDWNDQLTDRRSSNVFLPFLDRPESYVFLTLPLEEAGGSTYLPFRSFIDHVLITVGALEEYGNGQTAVLDLDRTVPDYVTVVSDHRPVLAVFELP